MGVLQGFWMKAISLMRYSKLFAAILCLALSACTKAAPYPERLPPLKTALNCLPKAGAIIAAHRGTSRDWNEAENSLSALQKLIKQHYLIAEIDVARLKDRTLITFHDGVWDDISTGKGPVASTTKGELDKILLKTRKGTFTSDRPALFEDMLTAAKDKIYLEIDFKSSVNIQNVIMAIKDYDMERQVLLIAYSANQAKTLRRLAPNMLISAPQNSAQTGELVWRGADIKDTKRASSVKKKEQYVIGRIGQAYNGTDLKLAKRNAHILVTDYPNQYLPLTGLSRGEQQAFYECLKTSP